MTAVTVTVTVTAMSVASCPVRPAIVPAVSMTSVGFRVVVALVSVRVTCVSGATGAAAQVA